MRLRKWTYAIVLSGFFAAVAHAQSLRLEGADRPIDVVADGGFEIKQDNKRVIARGNAKAVQGEVTVMGDELIADYRANAAGANEVYRVFVNGNVTFKSASETATGETAVYDFDKGVLVLEGKNISLVNPEGSISAHRALQYWSNEHVAVAEGAAMAEDKDKRRLYADKLIALFKIDPSATPAKRRPDGLNRGRGDISLLQGFGNVRMETAKEVVRGERGTYNVETGIATLDGAVKITRGNSQLGGGFAVVNVKGGTSRIYPSAKEAGMQGVKENGRVSALIAPSSKENAAKQTPPAAPAVLNKGQK
jgi:lipopolysaccharide export system protein LptA